MSSDPVGGGLGSAAAGGDFCLVGRRTSRE